MRLVQQQFAKCKQASGAFYYHINAHAPDAARPRQTQNQLALTSTKSKHAPRRSKYATFI